MTSFDTARGRSEGYGLQEYSNVLSTDFEHDVNATIYKQIRHLATQTYRELGPKFARRSWIQRCLPSRDIRVGSERACDKDHEELNPNFRRSTELTEHLEELDPHYSLKVRVGSRNQESSPGPVISLALIIRHFLPFTCLSALL